MIHLYGGVNENGKMGLPKQLPTTNWKEKHKYEVEEWWNEMSANEDACEDTLDILLRGDARVRYNWLQRKLGKWETVRSGCMYADEVGGNGTSRDE